MTEHDALDIAGVSKSFGGVKALRDVDLTLRAGETLGLLGPNGSGKTTLVNCLSGVVVPDRGSIRLDGQEVTTWRRTRRARLGMVRTYQNLRLFSDMTVAENIEVGLTTTSGLRRARRDALVNEVIDVHGLAAIRRTRVNGLSYGQQRRVEIARALIAAPRVLLLDEPAAGLGEGDTEELSRTLTAARTAHGCSILLIDHDVEFVAAMSDRVAVLHEGLVVRTGTPAQVQQDPMIAEIYLGTAAEADPESGPVPDDGAAPERTGSHGLGGAGRRSL